MGKLSVVAMSTPESDVAKKPGADETPADESTAGLVNKSIPFGRLSTIKDLSVNQAFFADFCQTQGELNSRFFLNSGIFC